jgi:uncharacterized protein (DUF1501 family)
VARSSNGGSNHDDSTDTGSLMTSRRVFIKSGAAAMLSLGFAPDFLTRAAEAADARKRLLVAIFQRGAVDGLNMLVPFGDAEYYKLRPAIAIAQPGRDGSAIDLDGYFGLHPRMASLKPLYDSGMLAAVHACGSPYSTRSHFDAQDYMESATPGVKSTRDGWLNRYLQVVNSTTPLQGVAVTRQAPRTMQGRAATLSFPGVDDFAVRDTMGSARAIQDSYSRTPDSLLNASARQAFDAVAVLQKATGGSYQPSNGAEYPRSPFGRSLQEVARIAKADVGLEVAFAESTGWDTHVAQGGSDGQLAGRLDDLARGIAALTRDLGDRMNDTVIMTMSEFGRTAAQNGSGGTDHGHGNAMMLIGGPVKGGQVYGSWPGLRPEQRFESRDLAITTDFRTVFAEVVTAHLGAPATSVGRILPGFTPTKPLGIIRTRE